MEPLIYYPTFEPPSDIWLKFALLYFEDFRSIVPHLRRNTLSEAFRRIEGETDLLTFHEPEYNDGYRASLFAIEEANKILADTYGRSLLFNEINVVRKWKNPDCWDFLIYQEKFSQDWVRYCEQNNIGRQTNEGILISEELAFLFMTYLAKEIAFRESAAIITDNNKFDNFTNYARATTPTIDRKNKFAKGIINLLVPQNLSQIPFQTLINFRNRNREMVRAFNAELSNLQDKISKGHTEQDFIDSYNNIYSDFSAEIIAQGIGIAAIPFAIYMLIQNPQAKLPEYAKEILGAVGMILGGGYALNRGLRDMENKRYCKKYIANLRRLKL